MPCYHHGNLTICTVGPLLRDWAPVIEAMTGVPDEGEVLVTCCNRIIHAHMAETRSFDGGGAGWVRQFRCMQGFGCTIRPSYKCTAHLREGWYWYDD